MDGFIADVAGEHELVEIQTASFGSARRKLERLVAMHRVVLVLAIPIEKWLVRVDADGAVLRRRRSPKHGLALDLFDELVHIPALVAHPNFRIELALTCEEEIRGPIPGGVARNCVVRIEIGNANRGTRFRLRTEAAARPSRS